MSGIDHSRLLSFHGKILVAGATGITGKLIVDRLCQLGMSVRAFVREANRISDSRNIEVVEGNALDQSDCVRAASGCDAIICTIGERFIPKDHSIVDGDGIINLVDAAQTAGVSRFILVSSLGVGDTWDWLPFPVKWFFRLFGLVPILKEKERSEAHLRKTQLDWTVIYPAMLTNSKMTSEPLIVKDGRAGGISSRYAVADTVCRCLGSPNSFESDLIVVNGYMRTLLANKVPFKMDIPWELW